MHQNSTACGKGLISTPMTLNFIILRNDKENKTSNMTVIDEDQQIWPKKNLVRSITFRNSKQLSTPKGYGGHMMAISSNESNNSAENEESTDSCIRAVNQRLQLSQPPLDFPTACDEIGAMKAIGTKLASTLKQIERLLKSRSKRPSMLKRNIGTCMSSRHLCLGVWFYAIFFIILSWNVCGLGSSSKRKAISKYIKDFNVLVSFITESKLSCLDSIVFSLWHGQSIKGFCI